MTEHIIPVPNFQINSGDYLNQFADFCTLFRNMQSYFHAFPDVLIRKKTLKKGLQRINDCINSFEPYILHVYATQTLHLFLV